MFNGSLFIFKKGIEVYLLFILDVILISGCTVVITSAIVFQFSPRADI